MTWNVQNSSKSSSVWANLRALRRFHHVLAASHQHRSPIVRCASWKEDILTAISPPSSPYLINLIVYAIAKAPTSTFSFPLSGMNVVINIFLFPTF
ncbi:uncharacterized protein LOC129904719 isoform X2 [Solanum dulcamara]|uniref:uncharacterized protein LOC129904719 isoform X2 n=1 Tax=Solanum dulcamara TaxID=45834 RepID=UPI0024854B38|nr:uncharacterized protein LOC129904719 isoform X2 [Solanum dulcamara]